MVHVQPQNWMKFDGQKSTLLMSEITTKLPRERKRNNEIQILPRRQVNKIQFCTGASEENHYARRIQNIKTI